MYAIIDESDSLIIQILCLLSQHFRCNDVNAHKLSVKLNKSINRQARAEKWKRVSVIPI